jgi:hypothetical protein
VSIVTSSTEGGGAAGRCAWVHAAHASSTASR